MARRAEKGGEARGRSAGRPSEIPRRGWRDILVRVKDEIAADNIAMAAAGVAFYALLALFPALAAAISIYGLIADPAEVQRQIKAASAILPQEVQGLLHEQLTRIAGQSSGTLGFGLAFGLALALWSAAAGVKALITALNMAYDEEEKRRFIVLNAVALALTLGAILFGLLALTLVVALPAVIGLLGLPGTLETLVRLLRWPLLAAAILLALAVLYRFGPSRDRPRWRWVSWGAAAATLLWIVASILFSWYVANFGSYNETYGSLGAVVILLMWFYLSAFVVLMGAELNAEMEHQTARDTTEGEPEPMGRRGAQMADRVAGGR